MARIATLLTMLLAAGCTHLVQTQCFDRYTGGYGLEPGDRVVARWRADFYDATVITVHGKLVTVAWDMPPPERSELPRGWVQLQGAKAELKARDAALCRVGEGWVLCVVEHAAGDDLGVTLSIDGSGRSLAGDQVLPVPEGLRAWARARLDTLLRQHKLRSTINPTAPAGAGKPVQEGQRVVAQWAPNSWWEATVRTVGDGSVTVSWTDGSGEMTLPAASVAPIPESSSLGPGDLAYCRWQGSQQWYPARVDRVGQGGLQVTYQDGSTGQAAHLQCLPAKR